MPSPPPSSSQAGTTSTVSSSNPNKEKPNKGKRRAEDSGEDEDRHATADGSKGNNSKKKKKSKHMSSGGPSQSQPPPQSSTQQQPPDGSQLLLRGKRGTAIYRVGRKDLKEDPNGGAERLRDGIVIHIRAFMGALKAAMVPDPPTPAEIAAFEQNRLLGDDPHAMLKQSLTMVNTFSMDVLNKLRTLRHECKIAGSDTASRIAQIPDDKIKMMFACMQEVGLNRFCPDVFGTPTSYFNLVHEGLALVTFTQVFLLGGYRFLGITQDYVNNTLLIQKLYRSFIFGRMRDLMRKEARKKEKCQERMKYHTLRGWHTRIKPLFEQPPCHSDHEDGPDGSYHVLTMPLRSSKVTRLYYETDNYRDECKKYEARNRSQLRKLPRIPHPQGKETNFTGLPNPTIPLDWFDPGEFNKLPMHIRAKYKDSSVVLPLEEKMQGPRQDDWKTMGPKAFMKKYGKEEEMEAAGINGDDKSEFGGTEGENSDDMLDEEEEEEEDDDDDDDGRATGEDTIEVPEASDEVPSVGTVAVTQGGARKGYTVLGSVMGLQRSFRQRSLHAIWVSLQSAKKKEVPERRTKPID
ncbi:hypothetical protein GGU10DRAFT_415415 [Lentinula aff. detonsa]|uniref:Uncharacterized protein n=1 Tax=Lentinula aff. detonsa TaxID=2804958 RepID=A0AA38NND3_9AGAR|nr:hypothetical protein GGU10DRAFT_415415 [Lentinula aff. detonsa]